MFKTLIVNKFNFESLLYYDLSRALSAVKCAKRFSDFVEGYIYFVNDDYEVIIYSCR